MRDRQRENTERRSVSARAQEQESKVGDLHGVESAEVQRDGGPAGHELDNLGEEGLARELHVEPHGLRGRKILQPLSVFYLDVRPCPKQHTGLFPAPQAQSGQQGFHLHTLSSSISFRASAAPFNKASVAATFF